MTLADLKDIQYKSKDVSIELSGPSAIVAVAQQLMLIEIAIKLEEIKLILIKA